MKSPRLLFEQYILKTATHRMFSDLQILGDLERDYGFSDTDAVKITVVKGRITIELA